MCPERTEYLAFLGGHLLPTFPNASPPVARGTATAAKPTEEDLAQHQDPHRLQVRDGLPGEKSGHEPVPQQHDHQAQAGNQQNDQRRNLRDLLDRVSSRIGFASCNLMICLVSSPEVCRRFAQVDTQREWLALTREDESPGQIFLRAQRLQLRPITHYLI